MELRATVRGVLAAISESVAISGLDSLTLGYRESDPLLRVISSIAAGADHLVAHEALAIGYQLQCVLPFNAKQYESDFVDPETRASYNDLRKGATSVLELDGVREEAPAAYERAGRIMLAQSDLLVAIWNGEPGAGRGGTAETVREAISRGIPVIWVHSNPPHRYQLILGDAGGEPDDSVIPILKEQIRRIVAPAIDDDPEVRSAYFNGSSARKSRGRVFGIFRKTLLIGTDPSKRRHLEEAAEKAEPADDALGPTPLAECFAADYRRADDLADHFGALYRDSFVANYLLAAAAVAMALIEDLPRYSWAVWVELLLLGYILLKIRTGQRGHWHERWLNFRILAEELRQASILYPFGRTLRPFRVPAHGEGADPNRLWVNWLARAKVREAGLVTAALDEKSVGKYRQTLVARLREQRQYHAMNHGRNAVLARRIHMIGVWFFFAAFVAVCVHALTHLAMNHPGITSAWPALGPLLSAYGKSVSSATSMLDALLPTVGAAFAGIGSQGEFGRISERSRAMEHHLSALITRALQAPPTSDACGLVAEEASDIMTAELLDWHVIFLDKGIEAPV